MWGSNPRPCVYKTHATTNWANGPNLENIVFLKIINWEAFTIELMRTH